MKYFKAFICMFVFIIIFNASAFSVSLINRVKMDPYYIFDIVYGEE